MNIVIAILVLLAYTLIMVNRIGHVPSSLSASVFWLPIWGRVIWTLVILSVCFLCVPTFVGKVSENTQFLAFLSIAGLALVGAAPLVRYGDDRMQFNVHQWGAIVCAFCSQVALAFNCPLPLLCWLPWVVALVVKGWGNWQTKIFWGEMVCFTGTFAYCLI